ncbi:MAG: cupin domain-containing protein [Gemmatimonadetes bacterium]|nr:cupin domain-containing protein [Gemmatimonadota bacterium]
MNIVDSTRRRRFSAEKMQKLNLFETDQMFCDVYCVGPGQAQRVHTHAGATKFYYVIEGEGHFTVGDRSEVLGPGAVVWSEPDEPHGVANESDGNLVLLVAMAPNPNR